MGANPIQYLVVPRFLGCLLMIPSLTIMADLHGRRRRRGSTASHSSASTRTTTGHNSQQFVDNWDLFYGIFKSVFFGATIAIVSCYRGFQLRAGRRRRRPGGNDRVRASRSS